MSSLYGRMVRDIDGPVMVVLNLGLQNLRGWHLVLK